MSLVVVSLALLGLGLFFLAVGRRLVLKLIGLLFFLFCFASLFLYINLRGYAVFTQEELIAKVNCHRATSQLYDMVLKYIPLTKGKAAQEQVYLLEGNQWMIEGEILKWRPFLNTLGFKTVYKVTRLNGRYWFEPRKEIPGPQRNAKANESLVRRNSYRQTSYTMNGGTDYLWLILYKLQRFLPFIEAVYGSGAYTFPDESSAFGVYVTNSGFIIKKL